MKVLVACEFSGTVRNAFIARGHDAMSCDLLETELPGPHYKGDVRDLDLSKFDLLIAHPPCTDLCVSGAGSFYYKKPMQERAVRFFRELLECNCGKVAIENPVGIISSRIRKPDQYIEPFQFGDRDRKKTGLWLKNLPLLIPTKLVTPLLIKGKNGKSYSRTHFMAKSDNRGKERSVFFEGIASAMAEQWGGVSIPVPRPPVFK